MFIDDHSPDDTVDRILRLRRDFLKKQIEMSSDGKPDLRIRVIRLAENAGQQAAVFCGLNHARGDLILTMDDDLQHPPSFIPDFIQQSGDYDLSYALPLEDRRGRRLKMGSRMRDWFFRRVLGCPSHITPGSFRIISRRAVEAVKDKGGKFVYVSALIFRSMSSLKVQNIYYKVSHEEGDQRSPVSKSGKIRPSRIGTAARLNLYLKLILFYGFPVYKIHSDKKAYILKDEL